QWAVPGRTQRNQRNTPLPQTANTSAPCGLKLQEILNQLLAILRQHALRMKLHALNRILLMTKPHDRAVRRSRCNLKLVRQSLFGNNQRMIARARYRILQTAENCLAVVRDLARLSMHQLWCANNIAAKSCANRLMSQADAKNRHLTRKAAN